MIEIAFEWFRDSKGYHVLDYGSRGLRIVGKGGRLVKTQPFSDQTFSEFASVRSQDDLEKFVDRNGLLHAPVYDESRPNGGVRFSTQMAKLERDANGKLVLSCIDKVLRGEDVNSHVCLAGQFRNALSQAHKVSGYRTGTLEGLVESTDAQCLGEVTVVPDRRLGLRTIICPSSLLGAMIIQLSSALRASGGANFRVCRLPSCQEVFPIGAKGAKRRDALYCCNQHRKDHHSKKRSLR